MKNNRLLYLGGVLFFIDTILVGLFSYLNKYINVDITAYIYTFFREKTGTSKDVITHAVKNMIPFIILAVVIPVFLIILFNRNKISFKIEFGRKNKKKHVIDGITLFGRCFLILCILIMFFKDFSAEQIYGVNDPQKEEYSQSNDSARGNAYDFFLFFTELHCCTPFIHSITEKFKQIKS